MHQDCILYTQQICDSFEKNEKYLLKLMCMDSKITQNNRYFIELKSKFDFNSVQMSEA